MAQNIYAIVGHFGFRAKVRGLSVFAYDDESGGLALVEDCFSDVNAGMQCIDPKRRMVYVVNELADLRGVQGGGGYLMALSLDPASGKLTQVSERPSLGTQPSYVCLDHTGCYALVTHHGSDRFVTKVMRGEDGGYTTGLVGDDATLALFRINPDGSLGEACDVVVQPGRTQPGSHMGSHQHAVVADPGGELFIVTDKGLDKLYTYGLDREKGKLVYKSQLLVEKGCSPRYGVFHPTLPIFYGNNETSPNVHAYRYDVQSGALELLRKVSLLQEEDPEHRAMPSDILLHPDARHLYVSIRGLNQIAMLELDGEGGMTLGQTIGCGGENPRGLCISPDGRFLFAANVDSGGIVRFNIAADSGMLRESGQHTPTIRPGYMQFFVAE